jgi:two-component sensor histidine kinase
MDVANPSEPARTAAAFTLVEEISHRVLNEYTLAILALTSAAAETTSPAARLALRHIAGRLQAHADVHRALRPPAKSGQTDLGEHLARVCAALASARLSDLGVSLTVVAADAPMSAERCWRVGLIVSELITNCVRHAFRERGGRVVVEVGAGNGMTWCRVSDNGWPPSAQTRSGRGRAIVEALAGELGGQVEWRFGGCGTTVLLSVPSDADAHLQ